MRRLLDWLLLFGVIATAAFLAYAHPGAIHGIMRTVQSYFWPCQSPVSYSLGTIDPRFGVSTTTFIDDLSEAQAVWNTSSGKKLLVYTPKGGDVTVSLMYDTRQAASDKLQQAGVQIDNSKANFDSMKMKYDQLARTISNEKAQYQTALAQYQDAEDTYNARVVAANRTGGASKSQYQQLQQQKAALEQQFERVKALQATVNDNIDTENAMASSLNQMIVQLNLNVAQYNRVGAATGEFEEGLYRDIGGIETIDIYEFQSHNELVRVLAHEMGHALGLEHVTDPHGIMYKVNQGENLTPTGADMAELDRVCKAAL